MFSIFQALITINRVLLEHIRFGPSSALCLGFVRLDPADWPGSLLSDLLLRSGGSFSEGHSTNLSSRVLQSPSHTQSHSRRGFLCRMAVMTVIRFSDSSRSSSMSSCTLALGQG